MIKNIPICLDLENKYGMEMLIKQLDSLQKIN